MFEVEGEVVGFVCSRWRQGRSRACADPMTRRTQRPGRTQVLLGRAVVTAAVLAAAVSCSSDGTTAPPTTPAANIAPASPSVSSASSTTSATTLTTIGPSAAAVADVRSAYQLASQTFSACLVAMPNCDTSTLAVARSSPLLDRNVARIDEWQTAGYTVRNRGRFRSVLESVELGPDARTATVMTCISDDSDLVLPGAGPGRADVIVDDSLTSGRDVWQFRLESDGVWRAFELEPLGATESRDVCPAS